MAMRLLTAFTLIAGGIARLQRRSPMPHMEQLTASSGGHHRREVVPSIPGFSDYRSVNKSLGMLAEATQWHGDVFGEAKERAAADKGLGMFKWALRNEWALLASAVVLLILVDSFCLRRFNGSKQGTHVALLCFWLVCGALYNLIVLVRNGKESAIQWCSGYFLEWLLSMDNLFVFHLIFKVYGTPKELLHKALFIGIVGAVVFRMFFFMALASLLNSMHWFRFVFGALLIYSGIMAAKEDDEELDVSNLLVVRWLKNCLRTRMVEKYDLQEHKLFIVEDGETRATLLVPVIMCLEVTDILFAVDSVSAKVAQIPNYYIAYSSSVLAMFGLRAMFFIIRDLVDMFDLLKYGLCFILVFIGVELLLEDYVQLPAQAVCVVVVSVFLVFTIGSTARQFYKKDGGAEQAALPEVASTRASSRCEGDCEPGGVRMPDDTNIGA